MAAYGDKEEPFFFFIFPDPDQRKSIMKGTFLLQRTGKLTGPTTCAYFFIDQNHAFLPQVPCQTAAKG
jgi:hypothetical protein